MGVAPLELELELGVAPLELELDNDTNISSRLYARAHSKRAMTQPVCPLFSLKYIFFVNC